MKGDGSFMFEEANTRLMVLWMLIAYLFSVGIRMIWVYQFQDVNPYYWNDELMINTNDGYYLASGAQKILEDMHLYNPRVPDWLASASVFFTVLLTKATPFSIETIILYLPAVISSLVVIPLILIGRLYNMTAVGFFAALLGSIAWSYYNRTMVGYYDTDMFSAMMPMFILYFLLATLETEKRVFMLLSALSIMVYPFFYDSGLSLIYAMGLLYMGYMLLFHRQERFTYESILLIAIALMGIPFLAKLILVVGLYVVLTRVEVERQKLMVLAGIAVLLFLYTGNVFALLWAKVSTYLFRGVDESGGLKFFEVAQTVREAGKIPFETMANRISGSIPGVLVALAGYIVLVMRHRGFILALPLIGIGVFSLWGGLRFTVYAVPVAAFGAIFLFYVIANYAKAKPAQYAIMAFLTAVMLVPNINHIIDYRVPTVFNAEEVGVLDHLKAQGSDKDYVIAWWDYGYPIWFYANKNTLIDGGKHNHDNYLVSRILTTSSQEEAAKLSRIAVETYIDSDYKIVADTLFKNKQPDQVNVDDYLDGLVSGEITLPEKSVDVYLYLPYRMMDIYPTVRVFGNIDLNSGKKAKDPFLYSTQQFKDMGAKVNLGNGLLFDKAKGSIEAEGRSMPLQGFYTTQMAADGSIAVQRQVVSMNGKLSLVFMRDYNRLLLMDAEVLNSTYMQMFIFENYDHELFELVESNPFAKVYRLKI